MASTNTKGIEVHKRCSWCATFLSPNNRQPDILTLEHDLLNNSLKSKLVLTSDSRLFAFIKFFFFGVVIFCYIASFGDLWTNTKQETKKWHDQMVLEYLGTVR